MSSVPAAASSVPRAIVSSGATLKEITVPHSSDYIAFIFLDQPAAGLPADIVKQGFIVLPVTDFHAKNAVQQGILLQLVFEYFLRILLGVC